MLLAVIAFLLGASSSKPVDLNLRDLSGNKVQLRDYRGKNVVLNLWATWCVPCREEMPMMVDAAKSWTPRSITFIAVSLDDEKTKKDIPAFVAKYGVTFPVWAGGTADSSIQRASSVLEPSAKSGAKSLKSGSQPLTARVTRRNS